MTYEVIILGHLHMPLYFGKTFIEYISLDVIQEKHLSFSESYHGKTEMLAYKRIFLL